MAWWNEHFNLAACPRIVIGADEVGLGAWAGPLGVTAVAVPGDWKGPRHLNDSKKLSRGRRESLYPSLVSLAHSSFQAHRAEIDRDGAQAALIESFQVVLWDLLGQFPDAVVVVDGQMDIPGVLHLSLPKADGLVPAVMAASVIAKVERDRVMTRLGKQYPQYGFASHVGYGTAQHQEALKAFGPCDLHRRSYSPIKKLLRHARQAEQ